MVIEDLSQITYKSKLFKLWSPGFIHNRLQVKCEDESVFLESIYAAYTSQTCSKCGHKDKRSRNGETFICMSCSHSIDADINAALNILDRSTNVSGQKHTNKQGAHSPLARAVSGIKSNNL